MNAFLWCATILLVALVPLVAVAATRPVLEALVAMEAAGVDATLAMLLLAEGTHSQPFVDLALVLGALSFAGAILFVRLLERGL